ncbi:hypothetical protein BU17DRAFT_46668 [Hysterangium stoloniferum]|nr:hypothetical protein BU17DRAFT_46668 [Hysterangium stoloniferum]
MASYTYIEKINSNLICCICHTPFIEPTVTTTCSHTFCKACITQALVITPQCPVDRSPLADNDLQPSNPIIRNLVDELIVECPQRSFGCSHTCQRQLLATHLKDDCLFVKALCCEDDCDEMMLRKDIKRHAVSCERRVVQCDACGLRVQMIDLQVHHDECPAEDATCPHCTLILPRHDMSSHVSICPDARVECTHAPHGCPWTGLRRELPASHIMQCPYEAIKGFLALHGSHISTLQAENALLRKRIEDAESSLRNTKRDLQCAKVALGPWFKPDGCQAPPRPSPPSEPVPRSYTRRRLSNALNSAMFGFSNDASPPHDPPINIPTPPLLSVPNSPPTDALAQFFPPEVEQQQVLTDAGMTHMADGTYPRVAPSSPVAPLNLDTTLEGSLASLRNSVVTLAASLDSDMRRHDIALTTETLRLNEEVMALRAIVHGLRMQVHQIMMDRNSHGREDEDGLGYNYSHARSTTAVEPWTSSVRYLNHHPPVHRPITIGTTTHIQTTKL